MGRHFGDLAVIRGVVYYKLSPHEQKPLQGIFPNAIPNVFRRTMATIVTWLPALIAGIAIHQGVEYSYHQSKRKNPKDYMNEINPNLPEPPPPPPMSKKPSKCESH